MIAAVSLMAAPIPNGEAELNAENNFLWPEAVEVTKTHQAHLMVAVLGQEEDLLERGKLYVKLLAACCRQKNALGVYLPQRKGHLRLYLRHGCVRLR